MFTLRRASERADETARSGLGICLQERPSLGGANIQLTELASLRGIYVCRDELA